MRDPRRLGPQRVNVQLALGDLADPPRTARTPLRGCRHRDPPRGGDPRPAAAPRRGDQRPRRRCACCAPPSAPGPSASSSSRAIGATRVPAHPLLPLQGARRGGRRSTPTLDGTVFAPSIVYDRDDPWVTLMRRLALLPLLPISGDGEARYQPIWAARRRRRVARGARGRRRRAGPLRARRARDAHLRRDGAHRRRARRAARGRCSTCRCRSCARGLIWLRAARRRDRVRDLGGGGADGGPDDDAARDRRRRGARGRAAGRCARSLGARRGAGTRQAVAPAAAVGDLERGSAGPAAVVDADVPDPAARSADPARLVEPGRTELQSCSVSDTSEPARA